MIWQIREEDNELSIELAALRSLMLLGIFQVEFENLPWRSELKSEIGSEGMYALWLDNCLEAGFWKSSEKLSSVGGMV